ncbi:hypothetical protein BGX26_004831, partial [Mortierella sp. AD094]
MVVADNHNQIEPSSVKRTVAISPLARSSPSLEEEGNSDMPAVAAASADLQNQSQSRYINNASSRLVAASQFSEEPLEDDDNADVSSLEQASDYDLHSEDSHSIFPRRQSSAGSFSAVRPLQSYSPSYYPQISVSGSSSHIAGSHLTRTNTESTDVL